MGEVIVYAEPESKNEAAQFVTSLGGHPQSRSLYSEIKSSLEKTKGLVIYLKGSEPLGAVRKRLRQVSRHHAPKTVVFTEHANQEKAAELGRANHRQSRCHRYHHRPDQDSGDSPWRRWNYAVNFGPLAHPRLRREVS